MINTEIAYVRDLQLIVQVFLSTLLLKNLLPPDTLTAIFANVEDILLVNTGFLSALEERQRECRLYVDRVGDVLVGYLPGMEVYLVRLFFFQSDFGRLMIC